jgi:hypothetical protein
VSVDLNQQDEQFQVSVAPNPFNDVTYLNVQSAESLSAQVKIMDMQGRLVSEKSVSLQAGMNTMILNELAASAYSGMYFVQVVTSQETVVQRIMKSK